MLTVKNLHIAFPKVGEPDFEVVSGVSLSITQGRCLGLVGESGSGKSLTALAIKGLLPETARSKGEIIWENQSENSPITGMIFQEPQSALNPVMTCGEQVAEAVRLQGVWTAQTAKDRVLQLFEQVKLPDPHRIFKAFPHELSGGQKQRVLIAIAICNQPQLLIADEPTTALDTTVQRAILDLLLDLRAQTGMSMLFISHDLGVVKAIADDVAVMQSGKIVECASADQIFDNPEHPYTCGLLYSRPRMLRPLKRLPLTVDFELQPQPQLVPRSLSEIEQQRSQIYGQLPLLSVKHLQRHFPYKKNWLGITKTWVKAVDGVDFEIYRGEILGIVGESGSGKSTLARMLPEYLLPIRAGIVYQDPYASLNPFLSIGEAVAEPLRVRNLVSGANEAREKALSLLAAVQIGAELYDRRPEELSGGQRQRVCIARALSVNPEVLICDEVTSALDVSIQATVLNLLLDLRDQLGLTLVFISHDLAVVGQMCDRIIVMCRGRVVETGNPEVLFTSPRHQHTRALVDAVL